VSSIPDVFPLRHILSASQFTREQIETIFAVTDQMRQARDKRQALDLLSGRVISLMFYEPSTRTSQSFQYAVTHLGARFVGSKNAGEFSSAAKGETVEDTVRTIASYDADLMVMRHKVLGSVAKAAEVSPIPIINAGDGPGEHPTQALLDLYTLLRLGADREETTLVLNGDLKYGRTVRSLCRIIIRYWHGAPCPIRLVLCAPDAFRMNNDILAELRRAEISFEETADMEGALRRADFFYQTRLQLERLTDEEEKRRANLVATDFRLDDRHLALMRPSASILHPLPRVNELSPELDADPRAKYLPYQTRNGMLVRMALLTMILRPDYVAQL